MQDLMAIAQQVCNAKEEFDKLPKPKNDKDFIARMSHSGEFLGMIKLLSYITGHKTETEWQSLLQSLLRER